LRADTLQISSLDGKRGLRLRGELDMASTAQLREALAKMPGAGQATIDLSGLTFIDSSGLHAIVEFAHGENGNAPLILVGARALVLMMFEVTNLVQHPNLDIRLDRGS